MEPLFLPYPDTGATYDPPPDLATISLDGVPITSPGWECEIYNATSYHIPIAYAVSPPVFVLKGGIWYVQQAFIDNVSIEHGFSGPVFRPERSDGILVGDPIFSITVGPDVFQWTLIDGGERQKEGEHTSDSFLCPFNEFEGFPFQSPNFSLPIFEWEYRNMLPSTDIPPTVENVELFEYTYWQTATYTLGLWERRPLTKGAGCSALSTIGKILIAIEGP
jgi:hypothetical protein